MLSNVRDILVVLQTRKNQGLFGKGLNCMTEIQMRFNTENINTFDRY